MSERIDVETKRGRVRGTFARGFERMVAELCRNFDERGEIGASVAVTVDGETVVDLWGGFADPTTGREWEHDTICVVFSSTKGMTALCAHVLASRGALDLDAPVGDYWPEFATAGKERARVSMMLDHSVAVPVLRQTVPKDGFYDADAMADLVASERAFWEPGSSVGYHALTYAWTVGEIVRRVSGRSLGAFFRDEIARPLGLDVWIGLPESEESRVAPLLPAGLPPNMELGEFMTLALGDPESVQALLFTNTGGFAPMPLDVGGANTRAGRAAEIGSANGVTNGRGLAGMYAPLACGGGKLVDADTLVRMEEVAMAAERDHTLLFPTRFTLGFHKSLDNRRDPRNASSSAILGRRAFGHAGAGGSIGFADPECRMSFGYAMTQMGQGILLQDRGQALIDAAYRSLGYNSTRGGCWHRGGRA